MTAPRTYYLVDGSGFIFRAFHALPMMTRRSDGTPVNAVYGFTNMLIKLLADLKAEHVAVIFDAARRNFRNEIYAAYKANRAEPPDELKPQFGLIRQATDAFSLPSIELDGYEADDLIASYCRLARAEGSRVVIVSSDKDLMQLVGEGVTMFDPIKLKPIDVADVVEKFGVPPAKVIDVQALAGDSVDNVPGVPGIGVKTAAQLIEEFGDLETLLARAGEIRQPKRRQALLANAEQARISRRLVTLVDDAAVPVLLADMHVHHIDKSRLLAFLREQEFRSIAARVEAQMDGGLGRPSGEAAPAAPAAAGAEGVPQPAPAWEVVVEEAALAAWTARAVEAGAVALKVLTSRPGVAASPLVGIALATGGARACYVPLGHTGAAGEGVLALGDEGAPPQIRLDRALAVLKPMLEDPSVLKVGHDVRTDYEVLARLGIRPGPLDDVMLISYATDGVSHGHASAELADIHLARRMTAHADVLGTGKARVGVERIAPEKAALLGAEEADVILALWRLLKPRLVAERMVSVYETIDRPLSAVVAEMELAGVRVDRVVLDRLSGELAGRMAALEAEVHRLAGHEFNIGSPAQLGRVLFDEMGLDGGRKGKTGAYSTHSDVLEPLAAQGSDLAARVLDWRALSKLKSTYTDTLVEQIDPRTGRVHTTYSLASTNTGRLASNDPNLQNIPIRTEEGRKIRYAFIADDGCRLVSVDYSQIELRLVAHIAKVAGLLQAFREGLDIHALTASQVFGIPLPEMTAEVRRRAKAINFGIIYGISAFGLANQLRIPQAEAGAFIRAYLERFSELKAWMEETRRFCREHGYVVTLFGRKCHMPGIKDPNPARRSFAERQAINAPIQGTAADIIRRAMTRIPPALAREGLAARMLLQVHDELLLEAPEAEAERTAAVVRGVMEAAARLDVPLLAEAGIGRSWAEAH